VYELALQGVVGRDDGKPHYSALCSCRTARFCEHAAALMIKLQPVADAPRRAPRLPRLPQKTLGRGDGLRLRPRG
ncbi:MAG: hypothetical protein ACOVLH_03295, partial [Roseateles sp.]